MYVKVGKILFLQHYNQQYVVFYLENMSVGTISFGNMEVDTKRSTHLIGNTR
jgi:hypothetical protein